ncbi:MAG: class I SAM-dependent methyltransferase [Paludibacteraceae bacterium]|nr:class I SAM-dependent methyltransferase [Paludibacteraceae bacterium]
MSALELALQRSKYKHLSDDEWHWFLQQVEGRERTADKLPTFATIEDWWYPVRLSCEQCSSELTAKYKASLINGEKMVDLTAGYGVDTYFLSAQFEHTDYVEQNAELCRIAAHNFANKPITIHNTTAENFLASAGQYDLIFADPARRDSHGGKVFRLADCTPNIVELLPELLKHGKQLLLKLSPMLDITQAIKELSAVNWDIHIVAVKNEVKEVLLLSGGNGTITAIDLTEPEKAFVFTREQESLSAKRSFSETVFQCNGLSGAAGLYLYEPSASILKAGAYKLIAQRFGLQKLDINTHLYASDKLIEEFPGRVWQIKSNDFKQFQTTSNNLKHANILCRNYPLTPEQLKKKLHLRDGGTAFVIGCRVNGKPTLFYAERV